MNGKALKKFITAIAVPKSLFDHLVANAKPRDVLLKKVDGKYCGNAGGGGLETETVASQHLSIMFVITFH